MCGGAIPFRYFLTELALGLDALTYFCGFRWATRFAPAWSFAPHSTSVALIDYDWRVIPESGHARGNSDRDNRGVARDAGGGTQELADRRRGGAGFLFVTGEVYLLVRRTEGVGMGDVFLIGMVGAFLGWPGVLFTMFAGSILGSIGGFAYALAGAPAPPEEQVPAAIAEVTGTRRGDFPPPDSVDSKPSLLRTEVPFGPFLALAAAIYALFQPQLIHWYLSRQ